MLFQLNFNIERQLIHEFLHGKFGFNLRPFFVIKTSSKSTLLPKSKV